MDLIQSLRATFTPSSNSSTGSSSSSKKPTGPKFYTANGTQTTHLPDCAFIGLQSSSSSSSESHIQSSIFFPRSIPTLFRAKRGAGSNYPLDSIVWAMLLRSLSHTDYMQKCKKSNIPVVSMVDRKELLDFLAGERENCEFLQPEDERSSIFGGFHSVEEAIQRTAAAANASEKSSSTSCSGGEAKENQESLFLMEKHRPQNFGTSKHSYAFILTILKNLQSSSKSVSNSSQSSSSSKEPVKAALKAGSKSLLYEMKAKASQPSSSSTASSKMIPSSVQAAAANLPTVNPIIIVPSSYSSLLNMFNVSAFLGTEECFHTPQEARNKAPGGRKESKVQIQRNSRTFTVIDNVNRLKLEDWNSVVAVFVQGEAWQFKGWKWATPVELFSKVKGFLVKYEDEAVPGEVKAWNVEVLNISKSKRHLDSAAVVQFWNSLFAFMAKRGL